METKKKVIVLGAGIAGLSAAYFFARNKQFDVTVLEQAPVTGGLCASFEYKNFTLDYGAHKIYSVIPGVLDDILVLMQGHLLKVEKKNKIFLRKHLVDYPVKIGSLGKALGPGVFLQLGFGFGINFLVNLFNHSPEKSYEEYMIRRFGRPAYELVFEPLADKVWGDPAGLHPEMARTRVPSSNGLEVILKMLGIKKETNETNAEYFYYPRSGFGDFPDKLKNEIEKLGGGVYTGAKIQKINRDNKAITSVDVSINGVEKNIPCDYLVSSIPLAALGNYVFGEAHPYSQMVDHLQFRHLVISYVFVKQPQVMQDQWIFFPERDYIFSRIFEQKLMNPELGPKDATCICCDFTCFEDGWQWKMSDDEIAQKCVEDLQKTGLIQSNDVTGTLVKRFKNFYPRYDLQYDQKLDDVYNQLKQVDNLMLTGRLGMYNYNNSDHCFDMGQFLANGLVAGDTPGVVWKKLEERVRNYKIVD